MDVRNEDGNDLRTLLSDPPKVLQVAALAALILGLGAALAYYAQYVFHNDCSGGWGIASATFSLVSGAVFGPALLIGFGALLLVRSDKRRDQATMMTRLIMIAIVLIVLSGIGAAVCLVGQSLSDHSSMMSGWYIASQAFTSLASAVFDSGVLLGLVYIFRLHERKYAALQLSENGAVGADRSGSNGI